MFTENFIKEYIENNKEKMYALHKELCLIPSPSHHEEKRAEFIKNWLENLGAKGVYIDEALNVIFPINCENSNEITVYAAHTDTVFPDTEPMPFVDDGEYIHCPGAGDCTAGLAALLMMAKFCIENDIKAPKGMMIVANSCEEGLGNLKGTRQLFKDYEGRIKQFITFDSHIYKIINRCVGSHRYRVSVKTEGGHSFNAFGNKNAIAAVSEIVNKIYSIELPSKEGCKVTYNVGGISGGTSVNTIAQSAEILCEYRSDDLELLNYMKNQFEKIFKEAQTDEVDVEVELIGDRPCAGNVDETKIKELCDIASSIINKVYGPVRFESGSTDCNIPMFFGVPAIDVGAWIGYGTHTREEKIERASLVPGLEIVINLVLKLMDN